MQLACLCRKIRHSVYLVELSHLLSHSFPLVVSQNWVNSALRPVCHGLILHVLD